MTTEYIEYKGKEYPAREVFIPEFGDRLVSVMSLEDELMPDGNYVDDEAQCVDEQIFFFVDDDEIDREDLGKYVWNECR